MTEIYLSYTDVVHDELKDCLNNKLGREAVILRTELGKPYIDGNGLYFSLSHSGGRAVFAVCDLPCGIDLEVFTGRERAAVSNRFSERERAEITCERDFLKHWTVREAYVKMLGLQIADMWKKLEFWGGRLYAAGNPVDLRITFYDFYFGVAALCKEKK